VPSEKIVVIPYGAPEIKPRLHLNRDSHAPLKVLFVGNLGQHKGIGYLLEAMHLLGGMAELTLVGRRLHPNAKVDEACRRWRWFESLPHALVLEVMQESDVLVLPSLSDAFGLVVTEALACGLPVIVTPNTGASEIIHDGREGYVVPIRRADLIASRLETLHADPPLLAQMSRHAQQTAAQNCWENYRANWAQTVRSLAWRSR
jgi:glycosyltransferase involved in cell wall biosynthesis